MYFAACGGNLAPQIHCASSHVKGDFVPLPNVSSSDLIPQSSASGALTGASETDACLRPSNPLNIQRVRQLSLSELETSLEAIFCQGRGSPFASLTKSAGRQTPQLDDFLPVFDETDNLSVVSQQAVQSTGIAKGHRHQFRYPSATEIKTHDWLVYHSRSGSGSDSTKPLSHQQPPHQQLSHHQERLKEMHKDIKPVPADNAPQGRLAQGLADALKKWQPPQKGNK